jgi:hypothetical protein
MQCHTPKGKFHCSGCVAHDLVRSEKYHAYARECLKLAEEATRLDVRERLVELSHVWMEAALEEEQRHLRGTPATSAAE